MAIHLEVSRLEKMIRDNTEATKELVDLLTGLRVVAKVGKWLAAVGAGVAVAYHAIPWFRNNG